MTDKTKKPSIDDIAKSLGVSKTLVSMVLNNKTEKYGISEITRKKVEQKIEELGFLPNKAARRLRTGKSFLIGIIVPDISNPFYSKIIRVIEDKVQLHGYHLMTCSSDEDSEKEKNLIKMLVDSQQIDGLILSTTLKTASELEFLARRKFPYVLMDRTLEGIGVPSVGVDNVNGAYNATETLIKAGAKNIAMFSISPGYISTIDERKQGYHNALKAHKINIKNDLVFEIPFSDIKNSVFEHLDELLLDKKIKAIDGLFVANNHIALACMEYFREKKIKVPEKLKFISFDDIDAFKFSAPTISAVEQPLIEIGSWSIKLLFDLLEDESKSTKAAHIHLPTKFIRRGSC